MQKKMIYLIAAVCTAGIIVVATAKPPVNRSEATRPISIEKASAERIPDTVWSVSALSWSIGADGTVQLAGLTRFEVDQRGRAIIEARPNGDFRVDPSLTIRLPVVEGHNGELGVIGLESATVRGENVVLIIDLTAEQPGSVTADGTDAAGCSMFKPINCDPMYCSGPCSFGLTCTWKVVGEDLTCGCVSPPE